MSVTAVTRDLDALTMTVVSEFAAPVARVWQIWADPRQLEQWWGPPTYPASVFEHDFSPGGSLKYWMTGPQGDKHGGWWRLLSIDAPHGLEFDNGFLNDAGEPDPDMPAMVIRVSLDALPDGGTRMTVVTQFPSTQTLEQLLGMGMEEGMTAAMGQIDAILAATP